MSSFKLVSSGSINDSIAVLKYQSDVTGLSVVLADIEGPVVNGHFVLATEAHDDDGLPHTLEHLIFLGSEKYPFKGVLDLLANRCLASGTNAWTDTDHTCYTMTTAGSDGFLDLMPIYLDHILYPTLSDSGFRTEVHHISGDGEDGGVVYCEMQGRENTGESRTILKLLRAVYPNSGYSSETGGIMHNLRTSTTNEKVRKYHASFYRPENLTLIITGKVEPEKVFAALQGIEDKIVSKGPREAFVKPWRTPVAPIAQSEDFKILYPSDEEDCGLVYIGFRGPNGLSEYTKLTACNILLRYLTDTSVSPMQREFVEIDDPYASKVSHSVIENLESLLYFVFDNVPVAKLDLVLDKLKAILLRFSSGEEKIDMKRMQSIIEREVLESMSNLESSPHDTAAFLIISDVIYGDNPEVFAERLNLKKQFEALLSADESFWLDLLNRYLINGSYICVRAYPSIEEQNRMSKEEIERIERQRAALGPDGLKAKAEEIRDAMLANETEPPECMLTEVPVPSTQGINYHHLKIYKSSEVDKVATCIDFTEVPVYAEVYDLHTNFIYLVVSLNTNDLDESLRPYLLLLLELILESPVQRGEQLIPYEEVVAALERDTICSQVELGIESNSSFSCGPFSHAAILTMQVDPKKFETGVNWIIELLHSTVFLTDRVKVCASKMFNAVSQAKRKGNSVVRDLLKAMYYPKGSNISVSSMLKQQKFLGTLLQKLETPEQAAEVFADLNKVRAHLVENRNMAIHIAANVQQAVADNRSLTAPWKNISRVQKENTKEPLIVIPDWKIINHEGVYPGMQGTVVGMGCVESAFLFHAIESINDFMDDDLPALMLYLQYLTQLEGPLWRQIRGQGFAYGYNIVPRPHEGVLCLTLYRASNVVAAFKETKAIIEAQLQPNSNWDKNLLESARSSLIFEIIERERSVGNLATQALLFTYKKVPSDYNQMLVKKVNQVTVANLIKVGEKYVAQLFSPKAKTAIVCHPDKVNEVAEAFKTFNRTLTPVSSLEDSILAQ